ncbi:hypothetical protein AB1I63_07855 [Streptococcus pneumoniae]
MLEIHKHHPLTYQEMKTGEVEVGFYPEKEFWCTDLAADCAPDDIAQLYAEFMTDLGDMASRMPSQLGFLTELPLDQAQDYMTAAFRFIKETATVASQTLMPKITKPSGRYVSIKIDTSLENILLGLEKLQEYSKEHDLKVDDILWQFNTDQRLIKNGSSAQQVLQYRIVEE